MQMAYQQFAFFVAQVHAVAPAIAEIVARGTFAGAHPFAVAVGEEAVFPYIHKFVLIDVALMIVGADAGARRDGAVYQYRADGDACLTTEQVVAHVSFVVAQEAFASVADADVSGLARALDEVQHPPELFGGELQFGIVRRPSYGEHGEEPPAFQPDADEVLFQFFQVRVIVLVHAGHYIEHEAG